MKKYAPIEASALLEVLGFENVAEIESLKRRVKIYDEVLNRINDIMWSSCMVKSANPGGLTNWQKGIMDALNLWAIADQEDKPMSKRCTASLRAELGRDMRSI